MYSVNEASPNLGVAPMPIQLHSKEEIAQCRESCCLT